MDPDSTKEILQIDERYRDVILIAERGLANAYSATDSTTGARVFLKILRESKVDDPHAFQLFCQEPALLQRIARDEPQLRVPQILATGYWEQRPYFTQPFLNGWSLDVPLKQRVRFSVSSIFRIFEDCLEFLSMLHDAGIVHGDVSPDNIFIQTDEPISDDGSLPTAFSVFLLDYNSSRRIDERKASQPKKSFVFLKLPYADPEIASGVQLSAQSDLYSLGVVLFELLVGARPHHDPESMSEVGLLRNRKIPRIPTELGIPLPIESFVRRLLFGAPTHRFESAAECLRELRAFNQVGSWLAQATSRETLRYRLLPNGKSFVTGLSSHSVPEPVFSELRPITLIAPTSPQPYVQRDVPTAETFVPRGEPIGAWYPPPNSQPGDEQTGAFKAPDQPDRDVVSAVYGVPLPISSQGETGIDLVDFSIFAPSTVQPASSFILELWAYMRADHDEAMERASKRGRLIERGSRGPVYVPGRSELTIVLRLDGFELQDAQDTILWASEITNVAFIVSVPNGMAPGDYPGQLSILHNGLLLARVVFEITVGNHVDKQVNLSIQREELKSAFASYASVDRDEVLRRVQGIQATGIDVFVDVLSLRSGADWEAELYRHIRSRDIFYLFWSNAARASEWVAREWHYALDEKGLDFIHPIPLAPPDQVPPPEELRSKHFDDIILACLKSQKVAALVE